MPKDYGQRNPGGGRHARGRNELPGWVWGFLGLSVGLAVAAAIYIMKPVARTEAVAVSEVPKIRKPPVALPPPVKSRFDFYQLLPGYEVAVPKSQTEDEARKPETPKPEPATGPVVYVLQVGSFTERAQAEAQKAQLALLGFQSRIEQVTLDGKRTSWRVLVGPEPDLAVAHSAMARLEESGIKSLLLRVKS